ncbi:hypothetical protein [Paragemmobacter aquarius]|nr:hypothetical protein [Gemmobacter aquarius]
MKYLVATALFVTIASQGIGVAQEFPTQTQSTTNSAVISTPSQSDAGAQSISGGNIFDFSGGEQRPPPPGMPSFAGGPCTGASYGASTSMAGIAVGAGRSEIDESCQRRNWVQTLIGASQHMPPEEAKLLLRVSIETMRDDPFLKGPLERAGLPDIEVADAKPAKPAKPETTLSSKSPSCSVMVSTNAPQAVLAAIEARGCIVLRD